MFSIATLRKLAFEVFEQSGTHEVGDGARGMTVPKSRGKKSNVNPGSEWLARLVKRFNKLDRVYCELKGCRNYQSEEYEAIVFTVSSVNPNPSGHSLKRSSVQTFLVTLNCRLVLNEYVQRRRRVGRYLYENWGDGPAREGLWLMECPVVGAEPKLAVPVKELAQLELFIQVIKKRQDRSKLQQKRKLKVSSLKQHAIVSKLKDLAKIHGFSFRIGYGVRDVTLSICLSKDPTNKRAPFFHMAFPHGKFDDVLEQAPAVIDSLKKLADRGMSFSSNNNRTKQLQGDWVETNKLKAIRKGQQ